MGTFTIIDRQDTYSKLVANKIKTELENHDFLYDEEHPELIITVGGDGTLLKAVHDYIDYLDKVCFVAVHTGTLGFFTDYNEDTLDECIQDIIHGEIEEIFESPLLEIKLIKENNEEIKYALNEMRIENVLRTQTIDIFIDDEFFEKFKGNGVCLSTQAGSTAYNRALGGAVVDSGLRMLQLCEISGIHNHQHNSLGNGYIMKEDRVVEFKGNDNSDTYICFDHLHEEIKGVKSIICRLSEKSVRFARYRKYSYLKRLRNLY